MGLCASTDRHEAPSASRGPELGARGSALSEAHSAIEASEARSTAGTTNEQAFLAAARTGNVSSAASLVSRGVNIDFGKGIQNTATALHEATKAKQLDMVKWLVENGARVDIPNTTQCLTPLHMGARSGREDILRALLGAPSAGAALNMRDKTNRTALYYVAAKKKRDAYAMMVAMGADDSVKDNTGMTPREKAIESGIVDA